MSIEIERKFLIDLKTFKSLSKGKNLLSIEQGYLILEDDFHCRIRITTDSATKKQKAVFATKIGSGIKRTELEEDIDLEHGKILLKKSLCSLKKKRLRVKYKSLWWDLDFYPSLNLAVAEVEIPTEDYPLEKPSWVLEEVSGVKAYSNIQIALKNPRK